ncbi:DNA repair protein RecO [Slackia heliotrinireducens]|uniref:DNA repair protein RecO n=1 Tax=Slackia heliotrinireducens TaxID=84110 RepID=UPI0033152120
MAQPTYPAHALVVRKTKLGETDLIVTLLADDGRLLRAVAKGARKPTSTFSSRIELFSVVDALLVEGRNLDILKEARLVDANLGIRESMERAAAASPILELAGIIAQPELVHPKLFSCTVAGLKAACDADPAQALSLSAACLLKVFSFAGFRPSFNECVKCGSKIALSGGRSSVVSFSVLDGGCVCDDCSRLSEVVHLPAETIQWANYLLMSTFADIAEHPCERRVAFDVMQLCQSWSREHVGTRLKSLDFLFTCGLF